eukprot:1880776-Rhodomonas_salina.1
MITIVCNSKTIWASNHASEPLCGCPCSHARNCWIRAPAGLLSSLTWVMSFHFWFCHLSRTPSYPLNGRAAPVPCSSAAKN